MGNRITPGRRSSPRQSAGTNSAAVLLWGEEAEQTREGHDAASAHADNHPGRARGHLLLAEASERASRRTGTSTPPYA